MMVRIVLLQMSGMCSRVVCGVVRKTRAACSRMWAGDGGGDGDGEGRLVGREGLCAVEAEVWAIARMLEILPIWRSCALLMGVWSACDCVGFLSGMGQIFVARS